MSPPARPVRTLLTLVATAVPIGGSIALARWMERGSSGGCIGCGLVVLLGVAVGTSMGLTTWYLLKRRPSPLMRRAPRAGPLDTAAVATITSAVASFFLFPVIPAVMALGLAPLARRRIRSSGGTSRGESLVTAGQIVAVSNIVMVAVAVLLIVVAS